MKKIRFILFTLLILLLVGCSGENSIENVIGGTPNIPEVFITHRDSILDDSLVIEITNIGKTPLYDVCVSVTGWNKKYLVDEKLNIGEQVEAGWMELEKGLQKGDEVLIYAKDYVWPYKIKLK